MRCSRFPSAPGARGRAVALRRSAADVLRSASVRASPPSASDALPERDALLAACAAAGDAALAPGGAGPACEAALAAFLSASSPLPPPSETSLLPGTWRLVLASNGTAVTRAVTPLRLVATGVRQTLQPPPATAAGSAWATTNEALLRGPLGFAVRVVASGDWAPATSSWGGPCDADVSFSRFNLGPLVIGVPGWGRRSARFRTKYLDADCRVAEGATGNRFVFVRD